MLSIIAGVYIIQNQTFVVQVRFSYVLVYIEIRSQFPFNRCCFCCCFFHLFAEDESGHKPEALNKKAVVIVNRVRDKLTGKSSL